METRRLMVVKIGSWTFEKHIDSPTINVFHSHYEVDVLTNYNIGRSWVKMQKATEQYVQEKSQ